MKKLKQLFEQHIWLRVVTAVTTLIAAFLICESAAFWLLHWVSLHWDILPKSEWLQSIILQLVSFSIMALIATPFGKTAKRQSKILFLHIINTIESIAKGDYKAQVPHHLRFEDDEFKVLVSSINNMATQLNELETMRQEFISNVSHEIQSPLTSIRGFARALQDPSLSAATRLHYQQIIENESMRLSKLSENLLKLTSLESDHHPFHPQPYRLDLQLKHIILAAEPQWHAKKLEIEAELPEQYIEADQDMLSQVWINLLHNSIKFTSEGGTIYFDLQLVNDLVQVQITDNGVGMDVETQQRIFERFYKADKSRNREAGGNGLGLSIVKRIIDMHQGNIEVASVIGEGTTFTVTLPLKQAAQEEKTAIS